MTSILGVVAIPILLGLAFLGLQQSRHSACRRLGPWIVGATACLIATAALALYDYGFSGLLYPERKHQAREILTSAVAMALLAAEAVLISHWVINMVSIRPRVRYLIIFTCTTLAAWFLTGLLFWATMPGS
jgi:phosphoglycerol transferase MdoB-like AlkP superfamily enzyme